MSKTAFSPDENLARCLAARRGLEQRFKSRDAFDDFLLSLEQAPLPSPRGKPPVVRSSADPFLGENVERCRRVRQELYSRFKTPDEMHAWLMSLEKQPRTRRGVKTAETRLAKRAKTKPVTRNSKPANGKPIHKT